MRRRRRTRVARPRGVAEKDPIDETDLLDLMDKVDEIVVDIANSDLEGSLRATDLDDYEDVEELLGYVSDFQLISGGLDQYVRKLEVALTKLFNALEEPEY